MLVSRHKIQLSNILIKYGLTEQRTKRAFSREKKCLTLELYLDRNHLNLKIVDILGEKNPKTSLVIKISL